MCRKIIGETAPNTYTQHARNPARNVQIGGDATVFAPNYGSPFAFDLDNGRRYATIEDFANFVTAVETDVPNGTFSTSNGVPSVWVSACR